MASVYVVSDPPTVTKLVEVHQRLEGRREAASTALRAVAAVSTAAGKAVSADGGAGGSGGPASATSASSEPELLEPSAPSGPRVIIVGPEDSGKSTTCRTLLAYAARMGWCPLYVDCDIGQGEIGPPGSLAASPVDRMCLSVEHGLERLVPITYFLGGVSAGSDPKLYSFLAQKLAGVVDEYGRANAHARASGVVINTMGWVDGLGYDLVLSTIRAFAADVVLVLGQVRAALSIPPMPHDCVDWRLGSLTARGVPFTACCDCASTLSTLLVFLPCLVHVSPFCTRFRAHRTSCSSI